MRQAQKLALVDGATRLTYAELDALVDRTAAALHWAGLGKGALRLEAWLGVIDT